MGSNLSKAYGVKWFYIGFLGLIVSIKSGIACAAFYLSKSELYNSFKVAPLLVIYYRFNF